jgi:NAD(P)-dependent dehydrogenase (short-subunit alcohol dehydrogenase family)
LLVIGGSGVLGRAIINAFKNSSNWKICVLDYVENCLADQNIIIDKETKFNEQYVKNLYKDLESFTKSLHAIINVAGGWIKRSIKQVEVFTDSEEMINKNYFSSLLSKIVIN